MSLAGAAAARGVNVYRKFMRPMRASGVPTCRFTPSCSDYALEAFTSWGLFRGSWLSVRRLARCQPWGGFGDDPVPTRDPSAVPGSDEPVSALTAQPHQPRSSDVRL